MGGGRTPGPILDADPVDAARGVLGYYANRGPIGVSTQGGPRLMLTGLEAAKAATFILATAQPYVFTGTVFGDVRLQPGTVWSGNRVLLDAGPMTVHYMVGDGLYEWRTSDFIRTEWMDAMARGAVSARWLVRIAKVGFEFACGLLVPWYGMLFMTVASTLALYQHNEKDMETLRVHMGAAAVILLALAEKSPKLSKFLIKLWLDSLLHNFQKGIRAEDIAFWLGRLIRGYRALPQVTARALLGLFSFTTLAVGVLHSPSIIGGAAAPTTEEFAQRLAQLAREQGKDVSREEAIEIYEELKKAKGVKELLENLKGELEIISPAMQRIAKYIEEEG